MFGGGKDFGAFTEQEVYIKRVRELLKTRVSGTPKACVTTYGCQQNVSDSQRIKGMLLSMGYELTSERAEADFILFNTCAVREHAEDRVWGNVGSVKKLKQENRDIILAVCGCMVQQEKVAKRFLASYPYVDMLFGTQVSHRLPEFIYRRLSGERRICELALNNADITEGVPFFNDGGFKAFLPIMYGCDNFCSYCIVPYVRGRERSRESAAIIDEAKKLIDGGAKEIMLLGQNVNSYGKGLSEDINFSKLLRMVNGIPGEFRIKFMTSNPKDCTEELLDTMRDCEKVERHLHLPFQSGSDGVLKRMNRKYTLDSYLKIIDAARERMPDITFTSDVIVGFPDESEEDFTKTLELVKKVGFSALFTFIYSKREGTPAAVMHDGVTREQKGVRFDKLLKLQEKCTKEVLAGMVGRTVTVLCEEYSDGYCFGKDEHQLNVKFPGKEDMTGSFKKVKIEAAGDLLTGVIKE
ncbi:MAG: tRNA (N6-isopentenyl adenosine(37)-C2)-methylthiotransferase MiaB [Clostridia bacterium]|nr:tRNA (N6-isopentenyl adenosine(37)-C2)-methylthiotransferase MiaB [Clostridia bacterium]